jgi:hypothetical protein
MKLFYKLLPQITITLNMLRKSRINPSMSKHTHLEYHYDFNRAPMVPSGACVIAYEKPKQRATWDTHDQDG